MALSEPLTFFIYHTVSLISAGRVRVVYCCGTVPRAVADEQPSVLRSVLQNGQVIFVL